MEIQDAARDLADDLRPFWWFITVGVQEEALIVYSQRVGLARQTAPGTFHGWPVLVKKSGPIRPTLEDSNG